ncbi:hypothetical protein PY32053_03038 [Paracoccus yeei]|uniref:Ribbon-helix-helix protein CopG domain-containing protein n=1 Tax=Paracoccus yeei TaxID=147645 RepID=A0A386UPD1_9RHOB|nr:hypothetical protein PY32053_03038 [Paracoccus yeei]
MSDAISVNRKRRGRPKVGATLVGVRIEPDLLAWLDAERAKLDPVPSRPEMVRQILAEKQRGRI